ncbi:MFS transporter [Microbispora sp. H10949]|uniref:MFS transporter n=1 Tax=Microbispora sp. H10949 TaxID=2729111 RepID=UPI001C727237|nr:MFS transporter [Microbispora sp. H10949]
MTAEVAAPLTANRDYRLLWGGRMVSELGVSAATIAFPLLALAVTGSAAASGLVVGTVAVAQLFAGLPAGALADRWNRKKVMLGCEAAQAIAAASLVAAVYWDVVSLAHLMGVAAVMGVCAALFEPAEDASLPAIVPDDQLPAAVAMNGARANLGHLAGTAAGGFLFAVGRFVPFAVDALTHVAALAALTRVRLPARRVVPAERTHLGREIVSGLRWVWDHPHVRVTAVCATVLNLFFSAFYLVVIVLAKARGVPPGEIGVMAAMLGVGGIAGALAAPYLRRRLTPYASIAGVFWALTALTPLAVFAGNGYVMGALFLAMALLPPAANTTIITEQLLLTPDELRGRLSGVLGLLTGVAGAAGPVLGGVLTEAVPGTAAVLACAAGIAAVTVLVTVNPTLRRFPRRSPTDTSTPLMEGT